MVFSDVDACNIRFFDKAINNCRITYENMFNKRITFFSCYLCLKFKSIVWFVSELALSFEDSIRLDALILNMKRRILKIMQNTPSL